MISLSRDSSSQSSLLFDAGIKAEKKIIRYAFNALRNEHDAEDVFQETMCILARRADEYDISRKVAPETWIIWIARGVISKHTRCKKSRKESIYSSDVENRIIDCRFPEPSERLEKKEEADILRKLIRNLPCKLGDLVNRYYGQGISLTTIAQEERVKLNTLSKRLISARAILREYLAA